LIKNHTLDILEAIDFQYPLTSETSKGKNLELRLPMKLISMEGSYLEILSPFFWPGFNIPLPVQSKLETLDFSPTDFLSCKDMKNFDEYSNVQNLMILPDEGLGPDFFYRSKDGIIVMQLKNQNTLKFKDFVKGLYTTVKCFTKVAETMTEALYLDKNFEEGRVSIQPEDYIVRCIVALNISNEMIEMVNEYNKIPNQNDCILILDALEIYNDYDKEFIYNKMKGKSQEYNPNTREYIPNVITHYVVQQHVKNMSPRLVHSSVLKYLRKNL